MEFYYMDFNNKVSKIINSSIELKKKVLEECKNDIILCGHKLAEIFRKGGKIILCGNGGSAADAQHIAAEFVIRYRSSFPRPALPALALSVDPSIMTAGGNDIGFENTFARAVEAYGKAGDALIGISTSGNSENVFKAMLKAKELGIISIGLLGSEGGKIADLCDCKVIVPSYDTARIQESHIMIGHIWCQMVEEILFLKE